MIVTEVSHVKNIVIGYGENYDAIAPLATCNS